MSKPRLSAVVVAWNSGSSLAECIESIRASAQRAGEALQVVVVDNGSTDSAVHALELRSGDVMVRNSLNAGYGVAAAQGIALSNAAWVLLVNPDLVVEAGFVAALMTEADTAGSKVATLVPEMRYAARPQIVNCRGVTVDEIGIPAEIDTGAEVVEPPTPTSPVLGGSSGCCLLRAEHVRHVGGPEPMFFAYLEDVDLALRMNCAGYAATFVSGAVAFHEGSASTGAQSSLKVHLVARNRRLLFQLHGPRSLGPTAWRTLIDLAHGAYSSLTTPLAPWLGRMEALRQRRYVRFLRRSRAHEGCVGHFDAAPRASLGETLKRKGRALGRSE